MRSDLELLQAWGSGELAAGNVLFERYLDVLYRFFRSKIRDDVSDLVQQTLLACVEGRGRLRRDASFRGYLFQTARHQLYGHFRHRKREAQIDFMRTTALDLGTSPSHLLAQKQEERILLYALQRVPLESQLLLELVYQEELSSFEIAEVFGITAAAVRGRHCRALEELRTKIADFKERTTGPRHGEELPRWVRRLLDRVTAIGPDARSGAHAQLADELDR